MGVIVISLGTSRSAGENIGCTWERVGALATSLGALATRLGAPGTSLGAPATSLGAPVTCLGAPTTSLGSPATTLGAPQVTVEQSGKTSSLGTLQVGLEIIATTHRSTIFKTRVFSLYSHLCIYIATYLHTVYLDWLQAVLESNSRSA